MICSSVKRDFFILPPPAWGGLYLKLEGFKGLRSGSGQKGRGNAVACVYPATVRSDGLTHATAGYQAQDWGEEPGYLKLVNRRWTDQLVHLRSTTSAHGEIGWNCPTTQS